MSEAERGPLPYQYMHYLMEKNADGSFPEKLPKNKRKVFFSKDLVQAQRECHLQNLIENCEFSPAPTPFTFPRSTFPKSSIEYFFENAFHFVQRIQFSQTIQLLLSTH